MKQTKRAFIAIKIEPEKPLQKFISELAANLKNEPIKWVEVYNLHLTLRFLGEITAEHEMKILEILDNTTTRCNSFQFELHGVGIFGTNSQPRVLFIKIKNDEALKNLAGEINQKLKLAGFEGDSLHFSPHLTIGRIKSKLDTDNFHDLINNFKETYLQQVEVSEVILYESILNFKGPVYKPIKIFKLQKS